MSKLGPRLLAALVAVVYLCDPGWSQTSDRGLIRGELQGDPGLPFHEYSVELADVSPGNDRYRADVQFDGSFQLRDILSGQYILRVNGLHGELVHQELVTVGRQTGLLSVRLPPSGRTPSLPGTISVTELRHPPAHKALQAMASAQRFSESGQTEKAVEALERAIRISPEYADAYNNLAVQHMRMGLFGQAAGELARAIAIAGPKPQQLSNLAFAQCRLNQIPEAIASARAALHMDPSSPQAHLILGSILAGDPGARAEAIAHLERAAETLPSARALLERLRGEP